MEIKHIFNTYAAGNLAAIFLGPNLAGKDFQAEELLRNGMRGRVISTGQLARDKRTRCPDFDKDFGPLMDAGDYLPDKITLGLVQEEIPTIRENTGFVGIVGKPRNKIQAGMLDNVVSRPNLCIGFRLIIENPDVILGRAEKRHKEKQRIDDLDEGTVLKRFNLWKNNEVSTIKKLRAKGVKVWDIDGTLLPDDIHKFILKKTINHHHDLFEQWVRTQPAHTRRRLKINPLIDLALAS